MTLQPDFSDYYKSITPAERSVSICEAIRPNENQISRAWKELFDWQYERRNVLLIQFLESLKDRAPLLGRILHALRDGVNTRIDTEAEYLDKSGNKRRMDILVSLEIDRNKYELGIESKVRDAGCQAGQREAYLSWTTSRPNNRAMIWVNSHMDDGTPTHTNGLIGISCTAHIQAWLADCCAYLNDRKSCGCTALAHQIQDFMRSLPGGTIMSVENLKSHEKQMWDKAAKDVLLLLDDALRNPGYRKTVVEAFAEKLMGILREDSDLKAHGGLQVKKFDWEKRDEKWGWSVQIIFDEIEKKALFVQFSEDETSIGWCKNDGTMLENGKWFYDKSECKGPSKIYHPSRLTGLYNCYNFFTNEADILNADGLVSSIRHYYERSRKHYAADKA